MIERLEEQVAASPNSPRLYEQLVELYQVTGDRDKLAATLTKAVEARPDAVALQLQLAKHYEQTGKPNEACDAYLAVLKQKPQWIADDLYQIRQQFERTKRTLDLAKAFNDVPLQQLGHPYYLIQIVSDLMQNEENADLAADMLERIVDAFPSYRNQMLSNIRDAKVWKNDKIYELGKRFVIPSEVEVKQSPWFGIDAIYSYSGNGTVNAMFHQMRDGVAEAGRTGRLPPGDQQGRRRAARLAWRESDAGAHRPQAGKERRRPRPVAGTRLGPGGRQVDAPRHMLAGRTGAGQF